MGEVEESILGMCVKPNIFNSILIWVVGAYLQDVHIKPNIFNSILIFVSNICGVETYVQDDPTFIILSRNLCQKFGGWKHISRMCKKNIFNSIPKFVQNIWGWKHISRMCKKNQHFQFSPDICAKHLGMGTRVHQNIKKKIGIPI